MARTTLNQLEQLRLGQLIMSDWESKLMSASEFAIYANEKLGVTHINKDHIYTRVTAYGLQTHPPARKVPATTLPAEVAIIQYFAHRVGPLKFINAMEDMFGFRMDEGIKRTYLDLLNAEASSNFLKGQ